MKQLTLTPQIEAAIKRSTDGSVDPSTVAVYEIAAFNTLPVNKRGLFNKARASETTLRQMADYLNSGTDYAPLQVEHNLGEALPVGRVFAGEVMSNADGTAELRTLVYLSKADPEGAKLIAKLDAGVIDEVSVGMQALHLNCSECGFDYRGADATFMNLYDGICANEHEVGKDGVHVIMNGLDKFFELSLVGRGAAQKTKVISRAKSVMGDEAYNRLAASGQTPEIITLFATPTTPTQEPHMDLTALVEKLTTAQASVQVKDGELTAAKAQVVSLSATVDTLTAENTSLKANADATKVASLTAEVTILTANATSAIAFVREEAVRLSVAAGLTAPAEGADLDALKASIDTARTKLRETMPVGGVANQQGQTTVAASAADYAQTFKTQR